MTIGVGEDGGVDVRLTEVVAGERPGWLAEAPDGHPVGTAWVRMPDGTHAAWLTLHVHPEERRRGVGTRLLDAAAGTAAEAGRTALVGDPVDEDAPGHAFAAARGLRLVLGLTYTRLELATANLQDPPAPAGYRLAAWPGVVPDALAESYADSRRAMADMPLDEMPEMPAPRWDVAEVRRVAGVVADRGEHLDTVAALDAEGRVVGFTEVVVPADGTGDGLHYGTGIVPEHRGRGLARWLKTEAVRRVRATYPDLAGLVADTADSNVAMRRVNEALGYRPTHRSLVFQRDLDPAT